MIHQLAQYLKRKDRSWQRELLKAVLPKLWLAVREDMSKKKSKQRKKKLMEFINQHKPQQQTLQDFKPLPSTQQGGTVQVVSTYKHCEHDGVEPIMIGGFPVHLGGCNYLKPAIIDHADLIVSLMGGMPKQSFFGQRLPMMDAELPDRGGVPSSWAQVINFVADEIRAGKKVVLYCVGGHGRTGVAAASLLAILEPETADPITAIRERYCKQAVESRAQALAVFALKGITELPEQHQKEFKEYTYTPHTSWKQPVPGLDGKSTDGKYYHHAACKCGKCKQIMYLDTPCKCGDAACLWDGVKRSAEVLAKANSTVFYGSHGGASTHYGTLGMSTSSWPVSHAKTYLHHQNCECGQCSDVNCSLTIPCMCMYQKCQDIRVELATKPQETPAPVTSAPVTTPAPATQPEEEVGIHNLPIGIIEGHTTHEFWCCCTNCIMDSSEPGPHTDDGFCCCMKCTIAWKLEEYETAVEEAEEEAEYLADDAHDATCECIECQDAAEHLHNHKAASAGTYQDMF